MVRRSRQNQLAVCQGTGSACGAAWRSSIAVAAPHGTSVRGRVAKPGGIRFSLRGRPACSSTSLSPQPSATWVLLRLASRARSGRAFEVALHNLPVKRDVPRRVPVVRLAQAVPPWSAPYLHR